MSRVEVTNDFSFVSNSRRLSLHMFFESGDHARRAMEPREDQVSFCVKDNIQHHVCYFSSFLVEFILVNV